MFTSLSTLPFMTETFVEEGDFRYLFQFDTIWFFISLLATLIAFSIITHHIWHNQCTQYAMPSDIFVQQTFECYNLGVNHILNRRIRDKLAKTVRYSGHQERIQNIFLKQ